VPVLFSQEMMKYDNILDLNSIYTNNIVSIQETYGIEAAYNAVIKVDNFVYCYLLCYSCLLCVLYDLVQACHVLALLAY
jgi:hypothetical protein